VCLNVVVGGELMIQGQVFAGLLVQGVYCREFRGQGGSPEASPSRFNIRQVKQNTQQASKRSNQSARKQHLSEPPAPPPA